jgi:hypothetical protein
MTVRLPQAPDSPGRKVEDTAWLSQNARIVEALVSSGTTANRPTKFLYPGRPYFDTDLADGDGKTIRRNADNTAWIETSGTSEIADNAITLPKMADIATDRLLGRDTAGTGDPEALTVGGGIEFTGSGGIQIANDGVTYARMQNVSATDKLLGRSTSGSGDVEEIACTAAGRALLDDADAAAQRATLGVYGQIAPGGRLTLTTATAVTVSDVTAATTVYYALYLRDLVPIYNGTAWAATVFTELSLALDSNSGHTGYQQSGKNFDLFVVNDAGTIRLGTGPAWTSDTGRGTGAGTTELQRVSGIWTNKVSMTLRWGSSSGNTITVAANQGTYVGTMRASADGQCEDSLAKRFLWNMYNRVARPMRVYEATDSWTYSTAAFRQMNNSSANQLAMVRGLDEDAVQAKVATLVNTSSNFQTVRAGLGLDSTTAIAAGSLPTQAAVSVTATGAIALVILYAGLPGLGYHYLAPLEWGAGTDTQTWYGDNGNSATLQNGIIGVVHA